MSRITRTTCAVLLFLALVIAGCRPQTEPVWVDDDVSYTLAGARRLLREVDSSAVAKTRGPDAQRMRQDALVSLRNRGGDAEQAATLVTKTFPSNTRAVPVYFERARVDGRDALLVIEAWGPSGSPLTLERLWIIDMSTGQILDSVAEH
ncbi:MAG: hypothetical protein HY876_06240 [Coriobacteriales bacterium]|nr:hypothetical protein [Coriobacteriales bacterium]